ncbi:MAG TPA: peptidoglycan bridge formation glycyltransferase FemA/FemB family protein [Sunxiuqinia sp.]|nr:peptidoglycan bridge formation glycyltransferase FemA/FemB family protein [Sunxiuqinia sp.]
MNCSVETKEIEAITSTNILPQTPFWARIKNEQGFIPSGFQLRVSKDLINPAFPEDRYTHEDLLVLIKYVSPTQCFAYVPYGPKIEPNFENHGVFLEELSEVLRPHLPANCIFIRYDLIWENQWAYEDDFFDHSGDWLGPPPGHTQEFRVNFSTQNWNLKKSPSDVLPKNTFFLDLTKEENELLYNMRYNTRYSIRKANRDGIRVNEYGMEHLDTWNQLYQETALRHNMPQQEQDYFTSLFTKQDDHRDGVQVSLLMADHDGDFLASMFLVLSRKRGTYLFGASSSDQKQRSASYALQWEAIKKAKQHGCSEYDMFGSAPNLNQQHPLHGVHLYKKGFGGQLYHRMGCWDYPFSKKEYDLITAQELKN